METAITIAQARAIFGALPRPLAFVPTMGALHEGHLTLVWRARTLAAAVGASIFVNPLQFGPREDLTTYPRDPVHDAEKLAAAGVDVLFAPESRAMYPTGFETFVDVEGLSARFEGAIRPGHFRGVATVVAKLLNVVQPNVLVLGQKDAQQAVLLRRMIADLDFPVDLELVPTVREADGLAMSSRNHYLDASQRAAAPTLYHALLRMREALEQGKSKSEAIARGTAALSDLARLDYLELVDAVGFAALDRLRPPAFIIGAARFGATRLIDNLWVQA
jgi:pantoate--beta-alanine ligase